MPTDLSDADIARLISEAKPLPDEYRRRLLIRLKRGHFERELDVDGADGSTFKIVLRQSTPNPLDFSIILIWLPKRLSSAFRLCRYNGKSHEHSNVLEAERFYDFHIYRATARYQQSGLREDGYAQATDRYQDYRGALRCMLTDCGFQIPWTEQTNLFDA